MTRLEPRVILVLMALLVIGSGGVAFSQSPVHEAAQEWNLDAQRWKVYRFNPLYGEVARALWSARPSETLRGSDIVSTFNEDYILVSDEFFDLMDRFFADDSPARELLASDDIQSQHLSMAMNANRDGVNAYQNILRGLRDASATAREIEYWYEIGKLWDTIARLGSLLYSRDQ